MLHATRSQPVKSTAALFGLELLRSTDLSKAASVAHPDSGIKCHSYYCHALAQSLLFDYIVIWPKHQFSHLQVMLFQDGHALQSVIWPVYLCAHHEVRILGLGLWTAPIQVQEPHRVCAIRICPAARHMSCGHRVWNRAELQLATVDRCFTNRL